MPFSLQHVQVDPGALLFLTGKQVPSTIDSTVWTVRAFRCPFGGYFYAVALLGAVLTKFLFSEVDVRY